MPQVDAVGEPAKVAQRRELEQAGGPGPRVEHGGDDPQAKAGKEHRLAVTECIQGEDLAGAGMMPLMQAREEGGNGEGGPGREKPDSGAIHGGNAQEQSQEGGCEKVRQGPVGAALGVVK